MAYYIFLKSLRSLEEFRKNPHVKIPPKSSSTIFQSLAKFKNLILIRKNLFILSSLSAQPACPHPPDLGLPASPSRLASPAHWPLGPRTRRWRILRNTLSSLNRAFRLRRLLSLPSLTCGPHMLVLSSSPRHREPVGNSSRRCFPRAVRSAHRMPLAITALPITSPPLISLNPSLILPFTRRHYAGQLTTLNDRLRRPPPAPI